MKVDSTPFFSAGVSSSYPFIGEYRHHGRAQILRFLQTVLSLRLKVFFSLCSSVLTPV